MITYNIRNMIKGWFIGHFTPSVYDANFEVGIKKYKAGDTEAAHYHKKSKEFTVVIIGKIKMNNEIFQQDDIIQVNENESVFFECIEDTITVVIKTKSEIGDKYYE